MLIIGLLEINYSKQSTPKSNQDFDVTTLCSLNDNSSPKDERLLPMSPPRMYFMPGGLHWGKKLNRRCAGIAYWRGRLRSDGTAGSLQIIFAFKFCSVCLLIKYLLRNH